jgi:outer membrane protein OmpA-like peptidoglycan-associated protein
MGVLSLGGGARAPHSTSAIVDPSQEILASLHTAERALEEIDQSLTALCREPVLAALELEPHCDSGTITLGDSLFGENAGSQLKEAAREDVRAAITTYLQRLRQMPAIWESLEAIEFRGHADPRALRNAYSTNLVGSQQRALAVLLFLVGPDGVSEQDQQDLERLATVSGASFSRPPASCPEATRECYAQWRRVEIRPVLSEAVRRGDWAQTLESVRIVTLRAQEKLETTVE